MDNSGIWVVKIGGSLLGSPALAHWLDILVKASDGPIIIVPGGGLFADVVRDAQQLTNMSDATAHQLAVLAMDQFGRLLASMNAQLQTVTNQSEILALGRQPRTMVWLPSQMVLAEDNIAKSWQVTSDSLSAWLANLLAADQLILVKSKSLLCYEKSQSIAVQQLIDDGLLDSQFMHYIAQKQYQTWLLNKADYLAFEQGLALSHLAHTGLQVQAIS